MKEMVTMVGIETTLPGRIVIGGQSPYAWDLPKIIYYTKDQKFDISEIVSNAGVISEVDLERINSIVDTINAIIRLSNGGVGLDGYTVRLIKDLLDKGNKWKCVNYDLFEGNLVIEFISQVKDYHVGDTSLDYHGTYPYIALVEGGIEKDLISDMLVTARQENLNTYRIYNLVNNTLISLRETSYNGKKFKQILEAIYKYIVTEIIIKEVKHG